LVDIVNRRFRGSNAGNSSKRAISGLAILAKDAILTEKDSLAAQNSLASTLGLDRRQTWNKGGGRRGTGAEVEN
jgi:hypothetical protein